MLPKSRPFKLLVIAAMVGAFSVTGCSDPAEPGGDGGTVVEPDGDTPQADAGDTDVEPDVPDTPDAEPDVPQPDTDTGPDPDTDTTADTAPDATECNAQTSADCDYDGLLDCEEEVIGTDACVNDTDGDGLNDMQELQHGTDPVVADTDGDGVEDGHEVDLQLDPNQPVSYADGINDGDRWVVDACDNPQSEPIDFYESQNVSIGPNTAVDIGNWRIALPPSFGNYRELEINGANRTNLLAAAVYDDPALEIASFTTSDAPTSGEVDAADVLENHRVAVELVSNIDQTFTGDGETHDYFEYSSAEYRVSTNSAVSTKELRDQLLFAISPAEEGDVIGLPNTNGAGYSDFRVFVTTIYRDYQQQDDQIITSVAVAPQAKFEVREKVRFRMDDLTNTTHVAENDAGNAVRCFLSGPQETPPTDFYWVLDHSASMNPINNQLARIANQFFNRLNNTALDYRLGVTTMEENRHGRLRPSAGWHTDLNTFIGEVNWVISLGGGWEGGLQVAREGIEFMKGLNGQTPPQNERIQPNSNLITIWVTDDESQWFQSNDLGTQTAQQKLMDYQRFYDDHSTTFAIVGDDNGCGMREGAAYKEVSLSSGGAHASVCSTDLGETVDQIILKASTNVGYQLPHDPITSSLRVYLNGEWVPRSLENGFDYQNGKLAFFGTFRPEIPDAGEAPDMISVTYQKWNDKRKPPQ